jgi:hypothetical protein
MRGSLGGLYCRRNLRVRGREKTGDLFGESLIGSQPRELTLPKIEVAPRQPVEFGRRIVVFRGHARTIADRVPDARFAGAKPALSHCGIGAKVAGQAKQAFSVQSAYPRGKRSAA